VADHTHEIELEHDGHGHRERSGDALGVLLPVVVLVVIIGAVLVGSYAFDEGEPEPPADPVALLASAQDAVVDAETAHMTMSMTFGGAEGEGEAEGSFPLEEMSMEAEGDIDFAAEDASLEMTFFGQTMEMRIVDDTMYQRLPAMMRPPSLDAEWIGMPADAAGGMAFNPLAGPNPAGDDMIEMLRSVTGELEELGAAEINGHDAWGYRGVIDVAAAVEEMSDEERIEANIASGMLGSAGMEEMPVEIWITEDGLPLRMLMTMEEEALFSMSMQLDFTDYGAPVTIEAPPEADVRLFESEEELEELMGETMELESESGMELEGDDLD